MKLWEFAALVAIMILASVGAVAVGEAVGAAIGALL